MPAAHLADRHHAFAARLLRAVFACSLVLAGLVPGATLDAGQVRVDVGPSSTDFTLGGSSLRVSNINLGDHVVWIWTGAALHTVTSGDSAQGNLDGTFNSDPSLFGQGSSTRFAWKSNLTGTVLYYCAVHLPDMASRIIITNPNTSPKVPVADFRITEVQYNVAGGQDLIELTNYGDAAGHPGRYRIAVASTGTGVELPTSLPVVPAGNRLVIHLNATGANTNTDVFIPSFVPGTGLPNTTGSLSLYVPNTVAPGNALTNSAMMLDFVQWGGPGQANEATAVTAAYWSPGDFIPTVAAGHSIEYCPDVILSHDASRWAEVSMPNFGSNGNCATPVSERESSWGRLKTLYRK